MFQQNSSKDATAAPGDAQYIVAAASSALSAERVATNTPTLTWDFATAAQAKANAVTQMSLTSDASGLMLSGDAASPGNSKYYGTNGSGTKGWQASELIYAAAPNSDIDITNAGAGGAATLVSKSVTVAPGDQIVLEVFFTILNNSTAARTYTKGASIGALAVSLADGATIGNNAAQRAMIWWKFVFAVSATNLAYLLAYPSFGTAIIAANTAAVVNASEARLGWNSSSNDLTGAQTVAATITSSATTATQTATLHAYTIRKVNTI